MMGRLNERPKFAGLDIIFTLIYNGKYSKIIINS